MAHLIVPADAPAIVQLAAASILYTHIGAGFAGLGSGFVAMTAKKGGRMHRQAGNVFFASMMLMAALGAAVAPFLPERIGSVAGLLTLYLVGTAWLTIRRRPGESGRLELAALPLGLATIVFGVWIFLLGGPDLRLDGLPVVPGLIFATFAAVGVAGDIHLLRRGGLSGAPRLARHIWRMCSALLLATLSFVAQPAAIPDAIEGSPLLFAPILGVLALTIYWLVRIRFPHLFARRRPAGVRAPALAKP